MAVSDADIVSRMSASGNAPPLPDASGSATSGASAPSAPATAPMATPEPKLGNKEGALVNLGMALDLIEQSLPALGSESPEGQKAVAAMRSLHGILGPRKGHAGELQPSEILQLVQSLPQGAGGPGGMPGGMPPGAGPGGPGAAPPMPMPPPSAGGGAAPTPPM